MDNTELEVALEELENRLERLRALYEQYFMGIERIEPSIARKDVDRRIYVLRREKIRNTARRFKLQTIISRYNTFQQYWQRICREIEQGTYKRHVIKAERIAPGKMLTIAARKRLGKAALDAMADGAEAAEAQSPSAVPAPIPAEKAAIPAPSAVPSAAPAAPGAPRLAPPPKPVPPPKPGARPTAPAPGAPTAAAAPAAPARAAFESLDLDMDFLGDWDPSSAASKPSVKRSAEVPARPFGRPLSRPINAPPVPAASAADSASKAPPMQVSKLAAAPLPPRVAPAIPSAASPVAGRARSSPPPKPTRPTLTAPPKPAAFAPLPAPAPLPARAAPPPAAAKSLAAPIPGASGPKPAAPSSATSDDRVRELHARLVEAKRQTQDGVAVSMEGLAKSMKATEAKLREQHKNRKIDFDVVIKDGKAVLKPIVR